MTKFLNKTKIEWLHGGYTWNPVTGCLHGCPYCYARKKAENPFYEKAFPFRFEPHFYPERVDAPLKHKTPSFIFADSMADMFGEWVHGDWLYQIFSVMSASDWHTFFILTKNPYGIQKIYGKETNYYLGRGDYLANVHLGVSVTGPEDLDRIDILRKMWSGPKFISFEPLYGYIENVDLSDMSRIILGAQTKPAKDPNWESVINLVRSADKYHVPVFMKDNLGDVWQKTGMAYRREKPLLEK